MSAHRQCEILHYKKTNPKLKLEIHHNTNANQTQWTKEIHYLETSNMLKRKKNKHLRERIHCVNISNQYF